MGRIVVTGIYTDSYKDLVDLQIQSCTDDYDFDFEHIDDEAWQLAASQRNEFAFFGGNTIKTELVIKKIKQYWGQIIIVSDADLVFLDKTEELLRQEIEKFDTLFLRERMDTAHLYQRAPANINIGFVVIKCNKSNLVFWERVDYLVKELHGWDQEIANQLLHGRNYPLKWNYLSDAFANGNDINADNLNSKHIATACGSAAQKYQLTKKEYLKKIIEFRSNDKNEWFKTNDDYAHKLDSLAQSATKRENDKHGETDSHRKEHAISIFGIPLFEVTILNDVVTRKIFGITVYQRVPLEGSYLRKLGCGLIQYQSNKNSFTLKIMNITCLNVEPIDKNHKSCLVFGFKYNFKSKNLWLDNLEKDLYSQNKMNQSLLIQTNNMRQIQAIQHGKILRLEQSLLGATGNCFYHFSAFTLNNAGDSVLVSALQKSLCSFADSNINFINRNVRDLLSPEDIYLINQSHGMIIGGGGLFLKDTNTNDISGWQFPIAIEQIQQISVPIYLMGIGYNRFRDQEDFDLIFTKNINAIIRKAAFIGIRNKGSIAALKEYLDEDLHDKLVFHPCATTILSKLYNIQKSSKEVFIAVECAFDRCNLRYGKHQARILDSIAHAVLELSKRVKIKYYSHMESDKQILVNFDKLHIKYDLIELNRPLTEIDIIKLYSQPSLVIGMRGHAQMIPFGCKTPILSLISHDKLQWFLDDIQHPEWGIDINSSTLETDIVEKAWSILEKHDVIVKEITAKQESFYQISMTNIQKFLKV